MINRAKMPRQLRNKGGIMTIGGGGYTGIPMGSRTGFGIISKIKKRVRKLIPNELANVAVKAAPFVAMIPGYGPAAAGIMRGLGRFDQRGSLSDAFKQGIGTYAGGKLFGAGMEKIGLRDPGASGIGEFFGEGTKETVSGLLKGGESGVSLGKTGPLKDATGLFKDVPILKDLPSIVQQQILVGGASGALTYIYQKFLADEPPQQEGETYEEYMARRKENVGRKMKGYFDNYFKFDKEYSSMTDEQKKAFIDRVNVRDGGRIGYQTGGITMANTLAENIRRNLANQAAFQQAITPTRERVKEQIRKRTPVQEYAMGEDSILGPLSKKAASTIIEGQDKSQAALDVLNKTMTPTGITATDTGQAIRIGSGVPEEYDSLNKAFTEVQAPKKNIDPRAGIQEAFLNERLSGGELFGDAIPGFNQLGTYIGDDPLLKDYAAAGRGTPTSQLVKLPADNPYAVSGAGYYEYDGTSFSKVADENPTPEYMKFLRTRYGLEKGGMPVGIMKTNKAGVMERDYRDKGGFVPVGIKEKADDVPAMLSKNEFVFTADAVRGAGNGSIEKGAQRMYDTMKKLEKRVV